MKLRKITYSIIVVLMSVLVFASRATTAYAMTNDEIRSRIIERLYGGAGGYLSCDYDGYVTTSGRHEGIDFACRYGTPIYAVFSGTVTGKGTSSTGVTILAVYNSDYDVTIVYEHASFSVSKGASVNVGTQLGVESNQGTRSTHTHFELREGYRTSGASNRNYTLENPNPYPYYANMFGSVPDDKHVVDGSYPTPVLAVPRETANSVQVYDVNGNAEGNRWIDPGDECSITAVYTDNWMQVSYPTSSGHRTAYVTKDVFFASNGILNGSWSPASNVTSYKYDNLTESFGSVFSSDSCVVVGQSNGNLQVIYPVSGGYKLGWVSEGGGYAPPTPIPDVISIPGPVAEGAFDGKAAVVMARERFDFDDGYISAGDLCIINEIDKSTGYCDVTYPSGGGNDVFSSSQKCKRVPMTWFVEYQPAFAMQKLTVPAGEQYQVYPLASRETYGRTWYLDPGDEYYTVAQANGLTEVLYYCTRGAHEGWWKLGWVELPYYWLDLNGWLDGAESGDLGSCGAADVWVNGNKLVENARDFYSANGTFPRGSTYEIKNVQAAGGYTYNGVHSGSTTGILKDNTKVFLDFTKNPVDLASIRMASNPSKLEYLEGDELDSSGMKVEAVNSDGTTSDVTAQCSLSGFDGTPGVKTVDVTYGGKSTAFTVVVRSKSPTELSVTSLPTKTTYNINDEVSLDGLQMTATYDNGTAEVVDNYEVMIDEGTTSTAGVKTVTVLYAYNNVEVETTFEITVSEQVPDNPPTPSDGLTLSVVGADQVNPGDTFDVNLCLSNNEGIASLKVKVAFDSNLLELTKVTYNGAMGGMSQQPQRKTPPVTLNWFNGSENFVGDATYATLTFTAIGVSGSNASVELTYNPNDVYDITETNVTLSVVNKTIAIGGGNAPVPQPGLYDKDGWVDLGDGRKGYALGGKLVTGWLSVGDAKYYFHDDGVMATGWTDLELDGKVMHYYFNPASGNLARGTWMTIDGAKYYFRPSGNVAHGWATISDAGVDKKYYFDDDFQLVTGWRDIDTGQGYAGHYYFRPSGSMATGWATIDGQKYWFRPSGNMATGFADVDDEFKRYFDADGHMLTGWQRISGKTYYFRPSGAMQTGEKAIDGTTYTFSEKGVLVGIAGSASTVAASALRGVVGLLASADELAATSGEDAAAANEDGQHTDAPLEMADEDEPLPDVPEDDSNPDVSQLDDGDESAEG